MEFLEEFESISSEIFWLQITNEWENFLMLVTIHEGYPVNKPH